MKLKGARKMDGFGAMTFCAIYMRGISASRGAHSHELVASEMTGGTYSEKRSATVSLSTPKAHTKYRI